MAFCSNCGAQMADNAKFCAECGAPTTSISSFAYERQQEYAGKILKCPNCGELISSFVVNCPACGYEVRAVKGTTSVRELSLRLEAIEANRDTVPHRVGDKRVGYHERLIIEAEITKKTAEQKATLIRTFPIPTTKEDLYEFLVLAFSNISMKLDEGSNETNVSDAWDAKFEQAYEKARLSFGNTQDFEKIQTLYSKKEAEVKRRNKRSVFLVIGIIAVILVPFIWVLLGGSSLENESKARNEAENERLKVIAEDVYVALADEDYVLARSKAASLTFLESYDSYKKRWDKTRTELLALIDAAENGAGVDKIIDEAKDSPHESSAIEQKPGATSNNVIEKDSVYTYGHDEWNLYMATAISDSIIKIEKWGKHLSLQKSFNHEYDVGSFKINDTNNGFLWVDESHTAFTFTLQDDSSSDFKKAQSVVLTISGTDSDTNNGTNYDEQGISYSYKNDDWHFYRAILLSETTVKFECWYRSISIGSFNYGYDVCVINLNDKTTDFEWTDKEKNAFTITMQDSKNSDLKEPRFVAFTVDK